MPKMKFVDQGVQNLEPEQPDTHTHTHTHTDRQTGRQTDRQTHATENITFPHSRLVVNKKNAYGHILYSLGVKNFKGTSIA